jgi:hypothetical protein
MAENKAYPGWGAGVGALAVLLVLMAFFLL